MAALLNATHPDIAYPLSVDQLLDGDEEAGFPGVNNVLDGNDALQILSLQMTLDSYNNLGCPLN